MIKIKRFDGAVLEVVNAKTLSGADLSRANLYRANLSWANLSGANLSRANLPWANLYGANLYGANLSWADLSRADLSGANLSWADLSRADLSGANLSRANLYKANLTNAKLPHFRILPERGSFLAYKALKNGLALVRIPANAARTNALCGRKCRAASVVVVGLKLTDGSHVGIGIHNGTKYVKGAMVVADSYDPDIRMECTHGIHFFMTKQEAVDYGNR